MLVICNLLDALFHYPIIPLFQYLKPVYPVKIKLFIKNYNIIVIFTS